MKNMKIPVARVFWCGTVVRKVCWWMVPLMMAATGWAIDSAEQVRVERTGEMVRMVADGPRPLHALAEALHEHFQLSVSVEDPVWVFAGDLKDASLENPRLRAGVMVPRGGRLEVEFKFSEARDAASAMMAVLEAANQQLAFQYRLDKDSEQYRLVPVRGRDAQGGVTDLVPLLDRVVSVPPGRQTIAEAADRMAQGLAKQTGLMVSCCQSSVAGIPWGMQTVTYGAEQLRARDVLKQLTELAGRPTRWFVRCDREFCFIDFR